MAENILKTDVLVVGGGPGGGMAALASAYKNVSVTLIERKEVIGYPVRCGEGTMGVVLRTFGLEDGKWIAGEIDRIKFYPPRGKPAVVNGKALGAVILDRGLFEQEIIRRCQERGAEVYTGKTVVSIQKDGENRYLVGLDTGEVFQAKMVIGGDGVESMVGRKMGITRPLRPHQLGIAVQYRIKDGNWEKNVAEVFIGQEIIPDGYAWIFPKQDGTANVGIGSLGNCASGNETIKSLLDRFIQKKGIGGKIVEEIAGAVPIALPPQNVVREKVALVGDAARHSYSVGGGGIHSALFDGLVAGTKAREELLGRSKKNALHEYDVIWKKTYLRALQRSARMKKRIYRSDKHTSFYVGMIRRLSPLFSVFPNTLLSLWWGPFFREGKKWMELLEKNG